jgi:large subunit ribosomal protein L21
MFAVIETGGKQYKVAPGTAVSVERLTAEPGATVEFDRVLMIGDDGNVEVGNPIVADAKVVAHVLEQKRGDKLTVFKYKAKSNYRRKTGHRQALTRVRVAEIVRG